MIESTLNSLIRDVPDFPEPGVLFKDITPVLQDGELFATVTNYLAERYADQNIDKIVGIESRGFIFGSALAHEMQTGLVLVRKPGKLPYNRIGVDYDLEYGSDRVEMHVDAVSPGERVIVIDDLLATGGTAAATVELLHQADAEIVAEPHVNPNAPQREIWFRDPDGYLVVTSGRMGEVR